MKKPILSLDIKDHNIPQEELRELEGNDKVCMVDFHTNDDSSLKIEHKSEGVITW